MSSSLLPEVKMGTRDVDDGKYAELLADADAGGHGRDGQKDSLISQTAAVATRVSAISQTLLSAESCPPFFLLETSAPEFRQNLLKEEREWHKSQGCSRVPSPVPENHEISPVARYSSLSCEQARTKILGERSLVYMPLCEGRPTAGTIFGLLVKVAASLSYRDARSPLCLRHRGVERQLSWVLRD